MAEQKQEPSRAELQKQIDALAAEKQSLAQRLQMLEAAQMPVTAINEAKDAWAQLSAAEKTKLVIDREYGKETGQKKWAVELPDNPPIELPANSIEEAVGRYNRVCGIRSTEHQHKVTLLTGGAAVRA